MFQGLFGNATEIDAKELQKDLEATIIEGETVLKHFGYFGIRLFLRINGCC